LTAAVIEHGKHILSSAKFVMWQLLVKFVPNTYVELCTAETCVNVLPTFKMT